MVGFVRESSGYSNATGHPLHVDVLNMLIVEMEGVINLRPLTALSTNSKDYEPLTLAHILYPAVFCHSSAIIIPITASSQSDDLRTTWKQVQSRINTFWKLWSQEYITLLYSRNKWTKTRRHLKIGDLVLIIDAQLRPF